MTNDIRKYINLTEQAAAYSDEFREALRQWVREHEPEQRDAALAAAAAVFDREMPVMAESETVWRGMVVPDMSRLPAAMDFRNRDVISFGDGYVSCTFSEREMHRFVDAHRDSEAEAAGKFYFTIETLAGARGADVDEILGREAAKELVGGDEYDDSEAELILDRGSQFRVTGADEIDDSMWEVELEQIK